MKKKLTIISVLVFSSLSLSHALTVLKIIKSNQAGEGLLVNGNFEQAKNGKPANWNPAPQHFEYGSGQGRNGSQGIHCSNQQSKDYSGASQTLLLNRTTIAPLIVRGWSKAQDVSGSPDNDYSLYIDIVYQDGTPLWGQTAKFRCGTHDWEYREFVIMPQMPLKSLTIHCFFRHHTGTVWFDDVAVSEITSQGGNFLFEGQAVQAVQVPGKPSLVPNALYEARQLSLTMKGDSVESFRNSGIEQKKSGPAGFMVRDVGANSDVHSFENGQCATLGLKLEKKIISAGDHLVFQGRLSDTSGKDRAISLYFVLPVDATGWTWGDDIRRSRTISGKGEFDNYVNVHCGATGTESLYPLGAIYNLQAGLAIGVDMSLPAQYRIFYHAGLKQLVLAYDFGLVKETANFPSSADFKFVLYAFNPDWGFRSAFAQYQQIFASAFAVRSHDQGIWMPFTDIKTVQGWQDFGFKYHEGNNNVPFDDTNNMLSFRYTEPMTWWMTMKKDVPRTFAEAVRIRNEIAKGSNHQAQMAQAASVAAMLDEDGQPATSFRDTPWCNGAFWSVNPNPYLPGAFNGATVHWNAKLQDQLYGLQAKGKLDGEYLDSLEGYVTADLNFNREHFRYTTVPLTFSSDTKRPALYKGLAVYEFTKWISDQVHGLGKLMFANGVPYRYTCLCPPLDVLGTETDWLRSGKYAPASDSQMSLWRTMSGAKPYLLLMNTDYDKFTPNMVEKYFQRSLFYGMFPSMFSHDAATSPYWGNPKWYNRDRPLFLKYQPLIKRIAEAGWQPRTEVRCNNDKIFVERFGPDKSGVCYLTLLNDTQVPQSGTVHPSPRLVGEGNIQYKELVSGKELPRTTAGWEIQLEPQQAGVISFKLSE